MELWHAEKAGWLKDAPFASEFLFFPSGAPQTEALAADQWDCGAMGTVPTMMASMRYGYKLIGISNDESETNDIWVRPDSPLLKTRGANPDYPDIYGTPEDWKGKKILGPTVSTGPLRPVRHACMPWASPTRMWISCTWSWARP